MVGCCTIKPSGVEVWSGREGSNLRPPVPKTGALPDCATPRRGTKRTRFIVHKEYRDEQSHYYGIIRLSLSRDGEMVDTLASGASRGNPVEVRIFFAAPKFPITLTPESRHFGELQVDQKQNFAHFSGYFHECIFKKSTRYTTINNIKLHFD